MIDVRRLRVLREVAEHGTLAAAADVLHLTPSAVSQQLAALEREVGQPVVERNGRGVRLTGAAEVLVGHANLVLAQLEAAEADVAAFADGIVGTVRVAGFATGLGRDRGARRRGAARDPPAADARLRGAGGAAVLRRSSGAATSTSRSRWPRARRRRPTIRASTSGRCGPTRSTPSCRRATRSRPLDEVPLAALAGEPFVGPPDGTSCHDVTVTGCAAAGFAPGFAHRSLDFHTTMALVAAGLGVALVPRLAQAAVPAGAAIRPLARARARPPRLRRHPRRRRAPPDGRRGARRAGQLRISLSTSSRLASMSSRETRLSRQRRRNGSVLDARTLKCQSS